MKMRYDARQLDEEGVERKLTIVVVAALLVQMFIHYLGQVEDVLRWDSFYYGTALVRLTVALTIAYAFGLSPRRLGIAMPRMSRNEALWLLGGMLVATLIIVPLLTMPSYRDAYQTYDLAAGSWQYRVGRWLQFHVSTSITWELFFRGFLLFTLREVLRAGGRGGVDATAIWITATFEVMYHLVKPPLEAVGMLVGSPALSWLALRQGSLWIPMLIHSWIEFLWFMTVWQ